MIVKELLPYQTVVQEEDYLSIQVQYNHYLQSIPLEQIHVPGRSKLGGQLLLQGHQPLEFFLYQGDQLEKQICASQQEQDQQLQYQGSGRGPHSPQNQHMLASIRDLITRI